MGFGGHRCQCVLFLSGHSVSLRSLQSLSPSSLLCHIAAPQLAFRFSQAYCRPLLLIILSSASGELLAQFSACFERFERSEVRGLLLWENSPIISCALELSFQKEQEVTVSALR